MDVLPAQLYLDGLSEGSRRTMAESLDLVAGLISKNATRNTLDWGRVSYQDTAKVRAALIKRYRPATARRVIAAMKGVLRQAWRLGQLGAEQYQRAIDLDNIRGKSAPPGRRVTVGELRALLEACAADNTARGRRDAAIIAVCYGAGLRRQEVVWLQLGAFDIEHKMLLVEGKGRRQRRVPLPEGTVIAMARWIVERGLFTTSALFVTVSNVGRPLGEPVSVSVINRIVSMRAAEAGLTHCSPHDLRRSYISELLDRGVDLALAQRLAGHASSSTTSLYDRRDEGARRRAADLIHVPVIG